MMDVRSPTAATAVLYHSLLRDLNWETVPEVVERRLKRTSDHHQVAGVLMLALEDLVRARSELALLEGEVEALAAVAEPLLRRGPGRPRLESVFDEATRLAAHAAFQRGEVSPEVEAGHREYVRLNRRAARARGNGVGGSVDNLTARL